MNDIVCPPVFEFVVVKAFVFEMHPLRDAIPVNANKVSAHSGIDARDVRALGAVLLGALDVVVVDVDANNGQVLRYHIRSVHAERERGSDADIEHLEAAIRV